MLLMRGQARSNEIGCRRIPRLVGDVNEWAECARGQLVVPRQDAHHVRGIGGGLVVLKAGKLLELCKRARCDTAKCTHTLGDLVRSVAQLMYFSSKSKCSEWNVGPTTFQW